MSQSFVGVETSSAPSASAPTCTIETMAKGTNPIQSRFMVPPRRACGTIIVARCDGSVRTGGVSCARLRGEVERDDRAIGLGACRPPGNPRSRTSTPCRGRARWRTSSRRVAGSVGYASMTRAPLRAGVVDGGLEQARVEALLPVFAPHDEAGDRPDRVVVPRLLRDRGEVPGAARAAPAGCGVRRGSSRRLRRRRRR